MVKVVWPPSPEREEEEKETGEEEEGKAEGGEEVLASGYCRQVALRYALDGFSNAAWPQSVDDVITCAQRVLEPAATRTEGSGQLVRPKNVIVVT